MSSLCLVYQVCVNCLKCGSSGVKYVSSVCQGNQWEDGLLGGQSPGGLDGQTDGPADGQTDKCVDVFVNSVKCGSRVCQVCVKCVSSVCNVCQV